MAANNAEGTAKTCPQAAPLSPKTPALSASERGLSKITDNALVFRDSTQSFDLRGALKNVAHASSIQDVLPPLRSVLSSLEALTKVHPFLAIVVIPFKAVMSLELRRLENDRRILVVITQMVDMMSHLSALPTQPVLSSIQQSQLHDVLVDVKSKIVDCGNAIDVYYKSKLIGTRNLLLTPKAPLTNHIVKIIKSSSWQERLEIFALAFSDLKSTLKMKLLPIINTMAGDTTLIASSTDQKIEEIIELLRRRTEFEIQLSEFIKNNGGIENAFTNDGFMKRLIKKFECSIETAPDDQNQTQAAPELPPRSTYGGVLTPRRQGSGGSTYPEPYQYNQHYPGPSYSSPVGPRESTPYTQDLSTYYNTTYRSILQHRSSYSRPLSTFGAYAPASSVGQPSGISMTVPAMPPLQPYPTTWRPTEYNTQPYAQASGQAAPGQTSFTSTMPPTGSQTSTPYNAQRTAMRTSIATRTPEEDVIDYTGSVKPVLLEQYRNEIEFALSTDLNDMLKQNEQIWAFKLRHLTDDINKHFNYGTTRVLKATTGGPHEQIKHPKLRVIWEQEKWRGSIGGIQLLQAVQDFMVEERQLAFAETRSESWAVKFLGVAYRVPLLQAIDRDYSGFVSIAEANRFTDEKPSNMSLLMWFAYSACAWAYEANDSRKRIHASWMRLAEFLAALANAPDDAIFDFETSIAPDVDALLGAIRVSPRRIADFTEHPEFLHLLRDQLAGKEEKLKGNLERVNWEIDSKATLLAVAGTGPLETYLLPILSILISHFVQRVEETWTNLTQREIFAAKDTLAQVLSAVDERVFQLVDCYPAECTAELSFGLYSQWIPKEWPTEPLLPELLFSPATSRQESVPPNIPLEVVEEEPDYPAAIAASGESIISQTALPPVSNSPNHSSPVVNPSNLMTSLRSQQPSITTPTTTSTVEDSNNFSEVAILDQLAMAPLFYVEALHPYKATENTDMDLEVGDRIAVIATPESGWWIGKQLNEERDIPGHTTFPSNYVRLLRNLD